MPWKRDKGKDKPKEGEDGEERVCRIDHCDQKGEDDGRSKRTLTESIPSSIFTISPRKSFV